MEGKEHKPNVGNGTGKQVRPLVHASPNKEPTVGTTVDGNLGGTVLRWLFSLVCWWVISLFGKKILPGDFLLDQVLDSCLEVVKDVLLGVQTTCFVPFLSVLPG